MAEPLDLNRERKRKAKAARKAEASANAVLHGLPKAAGQRAKALKTLAEKLLVGLKRDG